VKDTTRTDRAASRPAPSPSALLAQNRAMPESMEAEASVLGSMMIDPQCIGEVLQLLDAGAFYRAENQIIFQGLVSLFDRNHDPENIGVDLVLLRDELKKRKQLDDAGGVAYLEQLAQSVPSSANVTHYARIVKDKALLRELIQASTDILNEAYNPEGEAEEKLDEAEKKVFSVTEKKITGAAVELRHLLSEAFENIEKREGKHVTGLPTGFNELNELTSGLQMGELIIIAGRPSMGKTSFAINIAEHVGADNKIPIAIFSLEMSKQQLAERFLCSRSCIDSQLVRKGILSTEQHHELIRTGSELSEAPVFIDDSAGITPLELRAKARRLKSQHDIQCIMIDYLQLMGIGGRVESRQQEISTISRQMKALARELELPVIVLSQLNRASESREGHRPRMSDLRESGSIEQDADVIMLLHREDYYHKGEADYADTNVAEVIIAKQRNGPTGVVELVFRSQFTRFEDKSNMQESY
jgi:replicative DNA helicase